jgi:hypothetical protein
VASQQTRPLLRASRQICDGGAVRTPRRSEECLVISRAAADVLSVSLRPHLARPGRAFGLRVERQGIARDSKRCRNDSDCSTRGMRVAFSESVFLYLLSLEMFQSRIIRYLEQGVCCQLVSLELQELFLAALRAAFRDVLRATVEHVPAVDALEPVQSDFRFPSCGVLFLHDAEACEARDAATVGDVTHLLDPELFIASYATHLSSRIIHGVAPSIALSSLYRLLLSQKS